MSDIGTWQVVWAKEKYEIVKRLDGEKGKKSRLCGFKPKAGRGQSVEADWQIGSKEITSNLTIIL